MQTKIQKWGNSLGLRIPRPLADGAKVGAGSTVEVSLEDGSLRIRPVRETRYDLRDLLKAIRPGRTHGEVRTGGPAGREEW